MYYLLYRSREVLLVILVQSGADPHIVNRVRISLHQELIKGGVVMLGSCDLCSHCVNERCDLHTNRKLPYPDILQVHVHVQTCSIHIHVHYYMYHVTLM